MKRTVLSTFMIFLLSSCAHKFMRGTVAMKLDKKTAHVCLGDNAVKVGDKLNFIEHQCNDDNTTGVYFSCSSKKIGEGVVSKIINEHYSEVKTNGKFKFSEGDLVQRNK